jgi:hypothetical protein
MLLLLTGWSRWRGIGDSGLKKNIFCPVNLPKFCLRWCESVLSRIAAQSGHSVRVEAAGRVPLDVAQFDVPNATRELEHLVVQLGLVIQEPNTFQTVGLLPKNPERSAFPDNFCFVAKETLANFKFWVMPKRIEESVGLLGRLLAAVSNSKATCLAVHDASPTSAQPLPPCCLSPARNVAPGAAHAAFEVCAPSTSLHLGQNGLRRVATNENEWGGVGECVVCGWDDDGGDLTQVKANIS